MVLVRQGSPRGLRDYLLNHAFFYRVIVRFVLSVRDLFDEALLIELQIVPSRCQEGSVDLTRWCRRQELVCSEDLVLRSSSG